MFKMSCYKCGEAAVFIDEGSVVKAGQYICDKCFKKRYGAKDDGTAIGSTQVAFMPLEDIINKALGELGSQDDSDA